MKIFYPEPTERRRRLIARWLRKYRCLHMEQIQIYIKE
jgi:transposase-like protein